jgi:hypothetical protein
VFAAVFAAVFAMVSPSNALSRTVSLIALITRSFLSIAPP